MSIRVGESQDSDVATPGGLVAIQTTLDPSMTRSDNMSGTILTKPGEELPVVDQLRINYTLFDVVVGSDTNEAVQPIRQNEPLLLTIGTAPITGVVTALKGGEMTVKLKNVVALDRSIKVAISRNIQKRWRLIGYGEVLS